MIVVVPVLAIIGSVFLGSYIFDALVWVLGDSKERAELKAEKDKKKEAIKAKWDELMRKKKVILVNKSRNKNALELRANIVLVVNELYRKHNHNKRITFLRTVFLKGGSSCLGDNGLDMTKCIPESLLYVKETDEERISRENLNRQRMEEVEQYWMAGRFSFEELKPDYGEAYYLFKNFFNKKYIPERELEEISYLVALKIECYMPSFVGLLTLYKSEPTKEVAEKIIDTLIEVSVDTILPLLVVKKEDVDIDETVKKQRIRSITTELEEDIEIYRKNKVKFK